MNRALVFKLVSAAVVAWLLSQLFKRKTDTSSFGPVEHVGATGNTTVPVTTPASPVQPTPAPLTPMIPGQLDYGYGQVSYVPREAGTDADPLCECAPMNSFGPACVGNTWTAGLRATMESLGVLDKCVKLTADQAIARGYDPKLEWFAYDYREGKFPLRCRPAA
jgi:hypothetical protein